MMTKNYAFLIFDEDNTTYAADVAPAISVDFTSRIAEGIKSLATVLGITEMKPMREGTLVKQYKTVLTKPTTEYQEGKEIPITKGERKLVASHEIVLKPYRTRTTLQAMNKSGRNAAINEKDEEMLKEIRGDVKKGFFKSITGATGVSDAGAHNTLQMAVAKVWGGVSKKYEDVDGTPVFFLSFEDVSDYLGSAQITTQTAFGVQYLKDFMGLGIAIITAGVNKGEVYGTIAENLNGVYIPAEASGNEFFGFISDETGLVCMKHSAEDVSLAVNSIAYTAVEFFPEEVDGIFKATIGA